MRKQFKTIFSAVSIAVASIALSTAAQAADIKSINECVVIAGTDRNKANDLRMFNLKNVEYLNLGDTNAGQVLTANLRSLSQSGQRLIIPNQELRKKLIAAFIDCSKE